MMWAHLPRCDTHALYLYTCTVITCLEHAHRVCHMIEHQLITGVGQQFG